MRSRTLPFLFVLGAATLFAQPAKPVDLILDTDIGNDVDDALALAMIHSLQDRGEVRLLAVTITKDNPYASAYVDLVNTYYGYPQIPIGIVHHGKTPQDAPMLRIPAEERDAHGHLVYPHTITSSTEVRDAVELLKQVLKEQPDGSVVIAQIGFSTNLSRLIAQSDGMDLVRRKVRLLSVMGGNFEKAEPEFNIFTDAASAKELLKNWPTPIVFSGFEIGLKVPFTDQSIEKDFNWSARNPIVDAFKIYLGKPADRPNWDSTAVLYAIRPDRNYFDLSAPGAVSLGPKDVTVFTPSAAGKCRFLLLNSEQAARVQTAIEDLVTQPPRRQALMVGPQRAIF